MEDVFSRCHPVVNFFYFIIVIAMSMCCMHPVCLAVSLTGGVAYLLCLRGGKGLLAQCKWLLPMSLLAALLNAAFSHRGMTVLYYLPSGNPLTLESILYGVAAAVMIAAIFLWFACYTDVMTSDKFIYLFGKLIPALSLVLSMTLRFVPRFRSQMKTTAQAQKTIGQQVKGLRQRFFAGVKVFSATMTWALENAIETADSMRSRGYGEKGRTVFSVYRWETRDKILLYWLGFCGFYLLSGAVVGGLRFQYYPTVSGVTANAWSVSFFAVYGLLCLTPVLLVLYENFCWKEVRWHE